ncbi:hypothetical protein JB92DRAFT_3104481 [Gautieria morchelliformis]|nr:hypothetical protein JB92DRAFT_3104481 [Gautieria morchelliformis]
MSPNDKPARRQGPSNYELTKPWGGYRRFMASYGLKPGEEDEADAILDAFREADLAREADAARGALSERSSTAVFPDDKPARSQGPSNYELTKPWGGYRHFMASYGLKPGEEDEADAILDGFREIDLAREADAAREASRGQRSRRSQGSRCGQESRRGQRSVI